MSLSIDSRKEIVMTNSNLPQYESLEIGPGPSEERVAQKGSDPDFYQRNRAECRAFINQIRRQIGMEPDGATLYTKREPGGDGGYYEVNVKYDVNNQKAVEYAFKCEADAPDKWDNDAKRELGISSDSKELNLTRVYKPKEDIEYLIKSGSKWFVSEMHTNSSFGNYFDDVKSSVVLTVDQVDAIYELPNG